MAKFALEKKRLTGNFYQKMKILKEQYKIKENLYIDSMCRLIKELSRQINKNQTQEAVSEAKTKLLELSLVATEDLFKKMAQNSINRKDYEELLAQINKISEGKARKKCDVISLVNYIRRIIKGIETSRKMVNS